MKILVTVGTGSFDSLVSWFINSKIIDKHSIDIQYGSGKEISSNNLNLSFFRFDVNITDRYKDYDLIVCHCGAGTVFNLLESERSFITIPNTERLDKHQLELSNYLKRNNYCCVCTNLNDLENAIDCYNKDIYLKYKKDEFFLASEIVDFINH